VTAAKEMKGMVIPVIVNIHNEMGQLPAKVQEANPGGAYPYVIFADPAMGKIYGTYNHTALKGQNYRDIFRDAKKAASADIRNRTFNTALGAKAENGGKGQEADELDPGADKVIQVEDPEMETWTSSVGTTIRAKLISVENRTTFVLLTEAGKMIKVTADKLSPASAKAARELAGID
jgi:hypothetical protein